VGRLDAEQGGSRSLIADRHVAKSNCPVTMIKQGTRDNADRIREVDDPGILGGEPRHSLGDLQDHRHGPQRLGQSTGSGCFLTDATTFQWKSLVDRARRLAAHPQL